MWCSARPNGIAGAKNVYEMMPVSLAELGLPCETLWVDREIPVRSVDEHAQTDNPTKESLPHWRELGVGRFTCGRPYPLRASLRVRFGSQPLRLGADMNYIHTGLNGLSELYRRIDSRLILEDLFCKLALFAQNQGQA